MKPTPVLFLDLDGTVRLGPDQLGGRFVNSPADVELFDGMVDLIKSYKEKGWRIVAISNQGGIATGQAIESEVNRAMAETNRLCANLFDRMMWCPHHPSMARDNPENLCLCRKPRIGNVVAALIGMTQQFGEQYIPLSCLFVGDMEDDRKCAEAANIPFMWAEEWRKRGPLL